MTAPSHPHLAATAASRRRLRRLSRRFAAVGVAVSAARLAEIAGGRPATEAELIDVAFAETAIRIRRDQIRDQRVRAGRRCVHSAVVLAASIAALGVLLSLGLVFFLMAEHVSPF